MRAGVPIADAARAVDLSVDVVKKACAKGRWLADTPPAEVRAQVPPSGTLLSHEVAQQIRGALATGKTPARDLVVLHAWAREQEHAEQEAASRAALDFGNLPDHRLDLIEVVTDAEHGAWSGPHAAVLDQLVRAVSDLARAAQYGDATIHDAALARVRAALAPEGDAEAATTRTEVDAATARATAAEHDLAAARTEVEHARADLAATRIELDQERSRVRGLEALLAGRPA
ncbi:hypothetical protein [Sandaracinus amylolyticus]|uniref:hypothetical protein n=1 Tax=Sandaracinus amylolyticus TaxID=927083 RepID=UPI00069CCE52|nr:hypothetical protein [Sandaracinus amylolyticus]